MRINSRVIEICAFIISVVSAVVFYRYFLVESDFSWTATQSGTIFALLEIMLVIFVTVCIMTSKVDSRYKLLLLCGELLVFAFLHSFLWALLIGLLYIFATVHAGNVLCKVLRIERNVHCSFVLGFVLVITVVALLSLIKLATPHHLRLILPLFMAVVVVLDRKQIIGNLERVKDFELDFSGIIEDSDGFWALIFSIAAFCILIGKANYCTDYDSLWYGLKSEYVLAPFTGIYDNVNLMAAVYTYPKGFEIYTLLFAGLRSYSFIIAINVVIWLMICAGIIDIVKEFGVNQGKAVGAAMLLMLTPAVTNLVNTAKPDVVSLYLQIVGVLYSIKGIKTKKQENWYIAFSALIVTFAVKPTAILYSSLLIIIILIFNIMERGLLKKGVQVLSIPIVCCIVVFSRTMKLTGMPMTTLVVSMLKDLGFKIKYPYVLNSARVTSLDDLLSTGLLYERILRLPKLFFYPNSSDLVTTERTWWGMLFSVLWIIAVADFLVHIKKRIHDIKSDRIYGIINVMFLIISGSSVGTMLLLDYPDGNYYMIMQAITYVYIGIMLQGCTRRVYGLVGTLIAENIILSIVISCAWSVGFTPISIRDFGYYDHTIKYKETTMNNLGLRDIYEYMKERDDSRTLILSQREDEMLILPGINELYSHQNAWAGYSLESEETLYGFLTYTETDYLLVDSTIETESVYPVLLDMENDGRIVLEQEIDDFKMYKVMVN